MKTKLLFIFIIINIIGYAQYPLNEELLVEEEIKKDIPKKIDITKPSYLKLDNDSIIKLIHKSPSFSMFRDNYFITGIPANTTPTKFNSDIKFQISIRQRLIKNALPFNTFLMLTYTQKSFWNAYRKSSPFIDNNYNPTLTLSTPIIYKNQLRGVTVVSFEHESNGRDGDQSRSWNFMAVSGTYFFNQYLTGQVKAWAGLVDQDYTKDYLKYNGYGLFALNFRSKNDKIWCSLILKPRKINAYNCILEFNYNINPDLNQFIFIQLYNGYGEKLLTYNKFSSMIRVGISLKPALRSFY